MKWLPEPSEPELQPPVRRDRVGLVDAVERLELRDARLRDSAHRRVVACRPTAGPPRLIARVQRRRGRRGRSAAANWVRTAIMPQPMSTPTAAGMIAPTVGMTLPTVAPLPRCASGISARCGLDERHRRRALGLRTGLVLEDRGEVDQLGHAHHRPAPGQRIGRPQVVCACQDRRTDGRSGDRQDGGVARAGLSGLRELPVRGARARRRRLHGRARLRAGRAGDPAVRPRVRRRQDRRRRGDQRVRADAAASRRRSSVGWSTPSASGSCSPTGIGVVAVSSALAGLAQQYWQLLVLRGAGGVGSIMFSVSAASLLIRVTPSHLRGRAQGVWAGVVPDRPRSPARRSARSRASRCGCRSSSTPARSSCAGAIGARSRCGTASSRRARRPSPTPLAAARRRCATAPTSPRSSASFAGDFAVVGARSSLVPQFVTDDCGLGPGWVYVAFLVVEHRQRRAAAAVRPRRRHPRTPPGHRRRPAVGAVGFVLLPTLRRRWRAWSSRWCCSASPAPPTRSRPGAVLGDVVGGRGGTVVAVFQMAGDLGAVLGPVVAGAVADAHGYGPAFAVSAAVALQPAAVRPVCPGDADSAQRTNLTTSAADDTPRRRGVTFLCRIR